MKLRQILCLFAVLLSGCCPVLYTRYPGFSGRVLYADSRLPVSGAGVSLREIRCYEDSRTNVVVTTGVVVASDTTGANGVFHFRASKRLGIFIVPMDIFPGQYRLDLNYHVEDIGSYECRHRCLNDVHFHDLGDVILDLSDRRLAPLSGR